MGCDGGTIPRRDELVKLKKKPEQKDKSSELKYRWQHCALTQQKLQEPIVVCGLGRLYSKQNVIEHLLEKKMPEQAKHIKSLKDVKEIKLMKNPIYNDDETRQTVSSAPYICRLIGLEMNGNFRFTALWSCGCIFSERALKEIKSKVCPFCQAAYSNDDVIVINGDEEDVKLLKTKMEQRSLNRKKNKKSTVVAEPTVTNVPVSESTLPSPITTSVPSASTSASADNVNKLKDPKTLIKDTNLGKFNPLKRNNNEKYDDPDFKKAKNSYSVAQDPTASDVFKSLFTTHQSEKDQTRAHWVTYNPFYN